MTAMKKNAAGTQELENEEGGTAAEDAFEAELTDVIAEALDEDDEEEDDDLDDDDELDDDEIDDEDEDDVDDGEELDGEEEGDEGGRARNEDGTFAAKSAPATGTKAGEQKPDAAAGDAAATKKPDGEAAAPQWESLSVNVDKQGVPIEEAKISRVNGHVFIAVPEKDYPRFSARISRGVVGEKLWRDLHNGLRELDARKNAPARKSDAEIESELTLELLKPHLADILDDKDVALLEARIDNAKKQAKIDYDKAEGERMTKAQEVPWEEQQVNGIAEQIRGLVSAYPELQTLTREELEEAYEREFLPVRNSLVFKEGEDTFANTQYMYDRLKQRADLKKAASTRADSSAATQTPVSGNSASTATAGNGKTKTDRADRFNRGVDAAKNRTTSVKANRDADRPRKRTTRDLEDRPRRKKSRSPRQDRIDAEDEWRKTERAFLNSPSLDFDAGDDEG